jgi:alcohol dehydrogenase class IV
VTVVPFQYDALPTRVRFGRGTVSALAEEVERLSLARLLVVSTPQQRGQAELAASFLPGRVADIFDGAAMHTPIDVTERALAIAETHGADGIVAIGGGSAIGLGKAIALKTDFPQIVVPTTYAGSEATPILGQTENGLKTTQRTLKVLPEVIVYDVNLTLSLPVGLSMTSGLNAIAHAAEALYAPDGNPLVSLMAEQGIAALVDGLPLIRDTPDDLAGRTQALYGAWLCGTCLGLVGMALHHKICHTLGGTFDLPHAETHAIMLPHTLAFNLPAAPDARARLARVLRNDRPAWALAELAERVGAPRALRDIGMPESGIAQAAGLAVRNPYTNPRPIERDRIEAMVRRAWAGEWPDGESEVLPRTSCTS